MDEQAAVVVDASYLLHQDLYRYLEGPENLSDVDWTDEQDEVVRELLLELPMVIRHTIAPHQADESGECLACGRAWPCQVVTTVHSLVKHPRHQFVRLARANDD